MARRSYRYKVILFLCIRLYSGAGYLLKFFSSRPTAMMTSTTTKKEPTFSLQDQLPSLPVPKLEDTVQKYLASVKPLVTKEEYEQTQYAAKMFVKNEGQILQRKLEERAKNSRNWVREWWESEAYLRDRYPLVPFLNFSGSAQDYDQRNISGESGDVQIRHAAVAVHFIIDYWQTIRRENLKIMRSRGVPWCMDQERRQYNSARRPGKEIDELIVRFKTESEGSCPSSVIVMRNGHFWKFDALRNDGEILNINQLRAVFQSVMDRSALPGTAVNAMSCMNRDEWFEERKHLASLSLVNAQHLEDIDSSILIVTLTDETPSSDSQIAMTSIGGDARMMYADKCLNYFIHKNGLISTSCESSDCLQHTLCDAIVPMLAFARAREQFDRVFATQPELVSKPLLSGEWVIPEEMRFTTDRRVQKSVQRAIDVMRKNTETLSIRVHHFADYGNDYFKKVRVLGDTLCQQALQCAYVRLHAKLDDTINTHWIIARGYPRKGSSMFPDFFVSRIVQRKCLRPALGAAATYETASTRKFYHGRTETVRSCSAECKDFAFALSSPNKSAEEKAILLKKAVDKHNQLMAEAMNGQGYDIIFAGFDCLGIDRHFLGLRKVASDLGMKDPILFRDTSWVKSGGNGNFKLSTSIAGYTNVWGGVTAMCTDGYGTFYKILPDRVTFWIATWTDSSETRSEAFLESLIWSMKAIGGLIDSFPLVFNPPKAQSNSKL